MVTVVFVVMEGEDLVELVPLVVVAGAAVVFVVMEGVDLVVMVVVDIVAVVQLSWLSCL